VSITKPSMVLARCTAHWNRPDETGGWNWERCWESQDGNLVGDYRRYEVHCEPFMDAYDECFRNTKEDLVAYLHDDLSVYEYGWDQRVLAEFDDPDVGVVGFFGSFAACNPRLYSEPFSPGNFARGGVVSNLRREAHLIGERYAGCADISQFDGMALIVRRAVLEKIGGWLGHGPIFYWGYDMFLSYEARRLGYRLRMVGIDCDHWSGKTMPFMKINATENGKIDPCGNEAHYLTHRYLFDRYKDTDVIPYAVQDQRRTP
jgi:Glycosyltransferase like family